MSFDANGIISGFIAEKANKKTRAFGGTRRAKREYPGFLVNLVNTLLALAKNADATKLFKDGKYMVQADLMQIAGKVFIAMAKDLGLKTISHQIGKDAAGKPIMAEFIDYAGKEEHFKLVPKLDKEGKPEVDKEGKPVKESVKISALEFDKKMLYNTIHIILGLGTGKTPALDMVILKDKGGKEIGRAIEVAKLKPIK